MAPILTQRINKFHIVRNDAHGPRPFSDRYGNTANSLAVQEVCDLVQHNDLNNPHTFG